MNARTLVAFFAAALLSFGAAAQTPLPPWTPGTLDIHQISTGRGNSAFFIFPDGTTMLVDAGAAANGTTFPGSDVRPNATKTAGGWIAQYVTRVMGGTPHIDYAVLTHFHSDHMGQATAESKPSAGGAYKLTGITEVGDAIPIGTLIDRGDAFLPPPATDPTIANYRAFIDAKHLRHETIRVGRADQIAMLHKPDATFEVRAVAANGDVWTGTGDDVRHIFPPLDSIAKEDTPSENMCSIGLRIRYGNFRYFTGGDMPGVPDAGAPEWQSVERAVAKAIGPTDVHVANHHGSIDPESAEFLAALRSPVIILPAWSPTHPSQDALKRMLAKRLYPGPHDVFATTLREPAKESIGDRVKQLKAEHGHIVVRVAPGGATYSVYVLDDMSEAANVVATFGPYTSGH